MVHQKIRICDRCLAGTGQKCSSNMDYRNFGSTKAWDLTLLSHEQYCLLDAESLSPWMAVPEFRHHSVSFDWLHNVYLGTGRDLFASGLKTLVERGVYSYTGLSDVEDLLSHAEDRIRKACAEHKSLDMFRTHFLALVYGL